MKMRLWLQDKHETSVQKFSYKKKQDCIKAAKKHLMHFWINQCSIVFMFTPRLNTSLSHSGGVCFPPAGEHCLQPEGRTCEQEAQCRRDPQLRLWIDCGTRVRRSQPVPSVPPTVQRGGGDGCRSSPAVLALLQLCARGVQPWLLFTQLLQRCTSILWPLQRHLSGVQTNGT